MATPSDSSHHWPHAPPHSLMDHGVYMVTSATYLKAHHFRSRKRLAFLTSRMIDLAEKFGWRLQAWAVFSNHYHFIATSPPEGADSLVKWITQLHRDAAIFVNQLDDLKGRKVWWNYWDSKITFEKSYYARLRYVHENPVHHGLVENAQDYDWCSSHWFQTHAKTSFINTVNSFQIDRVNVPDEF